MGVGSWCRCSARQGPMRRRRITELMTITIVIVSISDTYSSNDSFNSNPYDAITQDKDEASAEGGAASTMASSEGRVEDYGQSSY